MEVKALSRSHTPVHSYASNGSSLGSQRGSVSGDSTLSLEPDRTTEELLAELAALKQQHARELGALQGVTQQLSFDLALAKKQQQEPPAATTAIVEDSGSSTTVVDLNTFEFAKHAGSDALLTSRIAEVIDDVKLSKRDESQRVSLMSFLRVLVRKCLSAQVYGVGGFALKTYLPGGAVEVTVCFSRGHESTWVARLVNALSHEACSPDQSKRHPISSINVLFGETPTNAIVQCKMGDLNLSVKGNQVSMLSEAALCEYVDRCIANNHMFKRFLILMEAWATKEGILGVGYLSMSFLRAIGLFIFNAFHEKITSPLMGLYTLWSYLENFNWDEHALTLYGPIVVSSLNATRLQSVSKGPCAWPSGSIPFITNSTLRKYMVQETKGQQDNKKQTYTTCSLNVIDPVNPKQILGMAVSYKNEFAIRRILTGAANKFRALCLREQQPVPATATVTDTTTAATQEDGKDSSSAQLIEATLAEVFSMELLMRSDYEQKQRVRLELEKAAAASAMAELQLQEAKQGSTNSPALSHAAPIASRKVLTASRSFSQGGKFDIMDGNYDKILLNLEQAKEFMTPKITEQELVSLIRDILKKEGSVPVGRMGSLLHAATRNHSLSSMLKERFGGLKRFLGRHQDVFLIGRDHKFNPLIHLKGSQQALESSSQYQQQEQGLVNSSSSMQSQRARDASPKRHSSAPPRDLSPAPHPHSQEGTTPRRQRSRKSRSRGSKTSGRSTASSQNSLSPSKSYSQHGYRYNTHNNNNNNSNGNNNNYNSSPYGSPQSLAYLSGSPLLPHQNNHHTTASNSNSMSPSPSALFQSSPLYGSPSPVFTTNGMPQQQQQQPTDMTHSPFAASNLSMSRSQSMRSSKSSFGFSLRQGHMSASTDNVSTHNGAVLTSHVAMDCEMVGVGPGGIRSALARVSIVNVAGDVVYDKHVLPAEPVTDYRTHVSGIRPEDLSIDKAISFQQAQRETSGILKNRILIGHGINGDLEALVMSHPKRLIRDTAFHPLLCPKRPLPLKDLAKRYLDLDIQGGEHDSVIDARTTLRVYLAVQSRWEKDLVN